MIDVHFRPTPNGHKISIMLEETGLSHRLIEYSIFDGDQHTPAFRKINPNGRIPAIVDHSPIGGGPPLSIFESGAILFYLAEKTGRFLPASPSGRYGAMQWLMWQMSGLGPMNGQAQHFVRYAPDGNDYAANRYLNESRRLLDVMEQRLMEVDFLAGEYSIADMACWPWVRVARIVGVEIGDRRNLQRWYDAIAARPAVVRGATLVTGDVQGGPANQKMKLNAEQWSNMFGERFLKATRPDG